MTPRPIVPPPPVKTQLRPIVDPAPKILPPPPVQRFIEPPGFYSRGNPSAPSGAGQGVIAKPIAASPMPTSGASPVANSASNLPAPIAPRAMKKGGKVKSYTTKSGQINLGSDRISTASKNKNNSDW